MTPSQGTVPAGAQGATSGPGSGSEPASYLQRVRGFVHRLTGGAREETYGLLGASTINEPQPASSGMVNWKVLAAAATVFVSTIIMISLLSVHRGSPAYHRAGRSGPKAAPTVQIGSPTTPHNRFSALGCPALDPAPPGRRFIQVVNECEESVWPGILPPGAAGLPEGGWEWLSGECKTLTVTSSLPSLRIWGRTHCDSSYQCITGSCITDGAGGCSSAGEAPCSLWEATLQDHCTMTPMVGLGPDFYDDSVVDGYNLPISAEVSGGFNVGGTPSDFSCQSPNVVPFDWNECPFELRVYADQIAGTTLPVEGIMGVNRVTSPCFTTPLDKKCQEKIVGCRSLCKSVDQGWIGYYIDNVEGDRRLVDPTVDRPGSQGRIQWSQQFLQGKTKCGDSLCKDVPAWGAFRGEAYQGQGSMKNLVCCDFGFRCSPYQDNNVPGGCPYQQACPSLGAGDPTSPYHSQYKEDLTYPQSEQDKRKSSPLPDWPLASTGRNYAAIYKEASPSAYSWQFNDASSTYVCCGAADKPGPSYIITFCPKKDAPTTSSVSSHSTTSTSTSSHSSGSSSRRSKRGRGHHS